MQVRRHHRMRPLLIAAAVVGVAAPAAQAGHEDAGTPPKEGSQVDTSLGRRVRVTPRVTIVEPSAFDWGDAGVGAAGAFGLTLLAGGLVIVSRPSTRVRRDPDAEASGDTQPNGYREARDARDVSHAGQGARGGSGA
jgi:hypothetical protein